MSKLVLFLADGTTLDVPLKRERMTIGRRSDNDICLPNLAVSGEHAAVVTILADSFLEDLGSTNGTLVNGRPIAKHFLRDGDQIDMGRHVLVYCADDNAVMAADLVRVTARSAIDLADQRDGKPVVRTARDADGGTMRRARLAANAAAERMAVAHGEEAPEPGEQHPLTVEESEKAESTARLARVEPAIASVKVLSGPSAGRVIAIAKPEVTIGRAGVQVALIRRNGEAFELKPVEGSEPRVNAQPVAAEGAPLAVGDVIEIAGARLEFGTAPQASLAP